MASPETRWIWIQIGIALFLVILLMTRGKNVGPVRLKLHRKKRGDFSAGSPGGTDSGALVPSQNRQAQRPLNVLFNFNGETFDAFEVLGLPAGAPWEMVESTYLKNFSMKTHSERALYEFAYKAIESSYQGQRKSS